MFRVAQDDPEQNPVEGFQVVMDGMDGVLGLEELVRHVIVRAL